MDIVPGDVVGGFGILVGGKGILEVKFCLGELLFGFDVGVVGNFEGFLS